MNESSPTTAPATPTPSVFDRVFAFCASLKLAVLTMCSLAGVLALGSVYEAVYGLDAVQVMIYRAPWFAWLLAILSLNIFAAAAIRFPWQRRQWAFLVTHLGLLVLLLGFAVGLRLELDGALALTPGQSTSAVRLKEERFTVEVLDGSTVPSAPTGASPGLAVVAAADVPISLFDAGVYPPLWRFALSPIWKLPDEPRWPEGRSVQLHPPRALTDAVRTRTGGTVRLDVIDWYPAAEVVPGVVPMTDGMREGATPYRPLPHSPRQAALAAAKLRATLRPDGGGAAHTREFWIGRDGAPREVTVGAARLRITYGILHADMGFAVTLKQFVRTTDPGAMSLAGMESVVEFVGVGDAAAGPHGTGVASSSPQSSGTGVAPLSPQSSGTGVPPVSPQPIPTSSSVAPAREARITLNNPVRHGGLTFYQAGSERRDDGTTISILSVNRDPGRWIKYAGCVLVVLGVVGMFVRGKAKSVSVSTFSPQALRPLASGTVLAIGVIGASPPARADSYVPIDYRLGDERAEPVIHDGRIKPFQAAVIDSLQYITGSDSPDGCENLSDLLDSVTLSDVLHPLDCIYGDPTNDRIEWFLWVFDSGRAEVTKKVYAARIILVDSREVAALFDIPEGSRHVSLDDVANSATFGAALSGAKAMQDHANGIGTSASLSAAHRALLRVEQRASALRQLLEANAYGTCFGQPTDAFLDSLPGDEERSAVRVHVPRAKQVWEQALASLSPGADTSLARARFKEQFTWLTLAEERDLRRSGAPFEYWWTEQPAPVSHRALTTELWYVRSHPFRIAAWTFLVACLLLAPAGLGGRAAWTRWLWWIGIGAGTGAVMVAAMGIYARIVITGRAPVTNMYESVVWAAAVSGAAGLLIDALMRRRFIALAGCLFAAVASLAADAMPADLGRTISNLQPILRDNFWLTTHVLSVVSGYAALAMAMVLGNFALLKELLRRGGSRLAFVRPGRTQTTAPFDAARGHDPAPATAPDHAAPDHGRDNRATGAAHATASNSGLHLAIYRCVQVGVVLMAAGTALGAVWADHAWGRFWAWDPKEVWALIVLLVYLAVLHGRLAGWLGAFGLAASSVLAFQTVIMAWYGVNFVLGAGLHTYGFGAGGGAAVSAYVVAQLALVALAGFVRHRREARQLTPAPSPVADGGGAA